MQVVLRNVGHHYRGQPWLFRGLNIVLEPNRTYALTGPSGSGKSTLLSILAGWLRSAEGDSDLGQVSRVGWVFQNPHGVPRRTAVDHVALPLLARGYIPVDADKLAGSLLERFGLSDRSENLFRELSGGESQRLMLARGIAANPQLFLIDEPTAQLDPVTANAVNSAISATAAEETIVVIATHDPSTRDACTDHIDLATFQREAD